MTLFDSALDAVQQMKEDEFVEQITENGKKGDLKFDLLNRIRDAQYAKTEQILNKMGKITPPSSVLDLAKEVSIKGETNERASV